MSQHVDKELRDGFKMILEREMSSLIQSLEQLIEMHSSYGNTIQRTYLYKARRALLDGKDWFDWERKHSATRGKVAHNLPERESENQ